MGRPSRIEDTKLIQRICTGIRKGNYPEIAAMSAGISERTYYLWYHRGQIEGEGPYAEFAEAIDQASAQAEMALVGNIRDAADAGDWKASLELLSRRNRRWARQDRTIMELGASPDEKPPVVIQLQDPGLVDALSALYDQMAALPPGKEEGDAVEGEYRELSPDEA